FIDADDVMADFRQARPGDKSDIAGADHANFLHESPLGINRLDFEVDWSLLRAEAPSVRTTGETSLTHLPPINRRRGRPSPTRKPLFYAGFRENIADIQRAFGIDRFLGENVALRLEIGLQIDIERRLFSSRPFRKFHANHPTMEIARYADGL